MANNWQEWEIEQADNLKKKKNCKRKGITATAPVASCGAMVNAPAAGGQMRGGWIGSLRRLRRS